jgi:hypothetical protein
LIAVVLKRHGGHCPFNNRHTKRKARDARVLATPTGDKHGDSALPKAPKKGPKYIYIIIIMAPTTSAWGVGSSARSCDALLHRIEINDPTLTELIILPIKSFGPKDLLRLIQCLDHGEQQGQQSLPPPLQYQINTTATATTLNTHLKSLQASGHAMNDVSVLEAFGRVLTKNPSSCPLVDIAIGDNTLGDEGMEALCRGLLSSSSSSQQQQQYQSSILADDERGRTITTTSPSTRLRLESIDFSWKGMYVYLLVSFCVCSCV